MRASARSTCRAPRVAPGVVYALSGAELVRLLPPVPDTQLSLPSKWTTQVQHKFINPQQPLLAHDKVRHVGEAVAVIVAESRYAAEDAAAIGRGSTSIRCRRWSTRRRRCARARPIIHERFADQPDRRVHHRQRRRSTPRSRARRTGCKRRFHHHRYAATPMECRGVVGAYDPRTDSVTIWSSTQVVHWVRREAAARAAAAGSAHPLRRARRRRRLRRQGPRLSGRPADSVPGAQARAAGAMDRGPARASACAPAIRATRFTTSRSASTTKGASSRCATISSSIAAPGIRSAPASSTTPPCICPAPTRSTRLRSAPGSPRPTRCRTRPIAAPAARKPRSRWSG